MSPTPYSFGHRETYYNKQLELVYLHEGKYWVYPRMVYKLAIVMPPGKCLDWTNFQNSNIKINDCWSDNDYEISFKWYHETRDKP